MIYICIGSGGVGKTTFASALSFYLAQEGQRVLVLTIDPSKRLKTTMGINDSEFKEIQDPSFTGSLHASVINHQKTFNDFLMRVGDPKLIEKIISNRLYQQLSTTLSGSQDFTALEKLLSAYESGKYDAIVLDTPPAQHAVEFLKSPQKLSKIFSESIAKWFRPDSSTFLGLNLFRKAMQAGATQILVALEKLTGNEFIKELTEFFIGIQQWQSKLEKRVLDCDRILRSEDTKMILVTSLDRVKLKEAEGLAEDLQKENFHLAAMVVNRAFPIWYEHSQQTKNQELLKQMLDYHHSKEHFLTQFMLHQKDKSVVVRLPELDQDVSDLVGVKSLLKYIKIQFDQLGWVKDEKK